VTSASTYLGRCRKNLGREARRPLRSTVPHIPASPSIWASPWIILVQCLRSKENWTSERACYFARFKYQPVAGAILDLTAKEPYHLQTSGSSSHTEGHIL
jgi:hypothetical protein